MQHIQSLIHPTCIRIFLLFAVLSFLPPISSAELIDKVVVVVNDEVITLSEVEEEAAGLYTIIAKKKSDDSMLNALTEVRETTLNALIDRTLISQKAKEFNVSVTDEEIDKGYDKVRARSKLSESAFKKKLEESGMTVRTYRANIASQILQSKLVSYVVRAKVVITTEMIRTYYDDNYMAKLKEGSYYLLQIGLTWDNSNTDPAAINESKEKTRKQAERVRNLAVNGQDFKVLAKKFSNLPSASDGGDIGTFELDEMAEGMRDAVAPLSSGEISAIVETNSGFQFFKLLSGGENSIITTSTYEEVKDEIKEKLYTEKLKETYSEWVQELKEKAYIQKL